MRKINIKTDYYNMEIIICFTVPNQFFTALFCDTGLDSTGYMSPFPVGLCQILPIEGAGRRLQS